MDPALKVTQIIGFVPTISANWITLEEREVLLETGDDGLVNAVLQACSRFMTVQDSVRAFNSIRCEFEKFLIENNENTSAVEGEIVSAVLPLNKAPQGEKLIGELNQLIGTLVTNCSEDEKKLLGLFKRVVTASKNIPGVQIPRVAYEDVE